ncbi:MAG: TolC family protein [Prevotella sp.]|nr:TolC family protein [Candidatus Prevotella equi]
MKRLFLLFVSVITLTSVEAQVLTLDSCRAKALRSNKQVGIARMKKEVATNTRKAARTKYLPHIDVTGGYVYSSREVSILNNDQKELLSNIGSIGAGTIQGHMAGLDAGFQQVMQGVLRKQMSKGNLDLNKALILGDIANDVKLGFGQMGQQMMQQFALAGDEIGQKIVDAFRTNTHHIFTASATLTQPLYMGGAIVSANKMADIAEKMADTNIEAKQQDVLFAVENAYWTVVSLRHKQRLAEAYLELVEKLNADVHKMIDNGVATRADGLKVDVAVNEAEMVKTKVDNGLTLAKMLLCKECGMPMNENITLEDELKEELEGDIIAQEYYADNINELRPELQLLSDAVDITKQQTRIAKAGYMPQVALMTGALFSSPSVYNSFERKFKGSFNVGVMVRVPVLDWGETMYKVRASKNATNIAQLQLSEAEELVDLQVNQCTFKVREANKNLSAAKKNIQRAEENLRCANVGFKEGVMQTSDVMAAQTAWLQAQTQKVDAEIDVKLSETALKKAVGLF